MYLIAGLGNPTEYYKNTRHNVGYYVIDLLAEKLKIKLNKKKDYVIGEGLYNDKKIILLKPLNFMNLSGIGVKKVIEKYKILFENLIVIHDDADLQLGRIKIVKNRSSGGHKGIISIIDAINTNMFIRLRIGIGRPKEAGTLTDYVLSKFTAEELERIKKIAEISINAIEKIISNSIEAAMNEFNRKS